MIDKLTSEPGDMRDATARLTAQDCRSERGLVVMGRSITRALEVPI
jgi:hypothetical protein